MVFSPFFLLGTMLASRLDLGSIALKVFMQKSWMFELFLDVTSISSGSNDESIYNRDWLLSLRILEATPTGSVLTLNSRYKIC